MTYEIVWDPKTKKCLKKLETKWIREIIRKVRECAENPFLYLKKLKGDNGWRLRVGDFRVIIDIYSAENKMNITTLGHRKDIYKEV
ncbi:MAG: type II toxin-antitoxin system RelE/ParE family toxin [Candidatus Undinarchaeales archaeon]|jgi:mRNA interferase RelE/StbE|nr:type II toxin-antitoxin system RelE/ParE family toxin [Candidatus Undinarchaeales archaeon]